MNSDNTDKVLMHFSTNMASKISANVSANLRVIDEETKKIRRTQEEIFKGKLTEKETYCLLYLNSWDPDEALQDFCTSSISDLSQKIEGTQEDLKVKKDQVLKALREKSETGKVRKEYACRPCDRVWWLWTPARKQVAECRTCKVKYDPVPDDKVFGWAVYECSCGKIFNGYGQIGKTESKCYKRRGGCGKTMLPTKILPGGRKGKPKPISVKTNNKPTDTHIPETKEVTDQTGDTGLAYPESEGATGGSNQTGNGGRKKHPQQNYNQDLYADMGRPLYTGGYQEKTTYIGKSVRAGIHVGHELKKMPWPGDKQKKSSKKSPLEARVLAAGKKKVLYASSPHISTGSTVADYLTQDDDMSVTSSFIASLQVINEDDPSSDSD